MNEWVKEGAGESDRQRTPGSDQCHCPAARLGVTAVFTDFGFCARVEGKLQRPVAMHAFLEVSNISG